MWSRARDGECARVRVDDAEKAKSGIRLSSRPTARKHEETGEELASIERQFYVKEKECPVIERKEVFLLDIARNVAQIHSQKIFDSLRRFLFWII